jgi:DNA-binding beta-propeller fold protein YncE
MNARRKIHYLVLGFVAALLLPASASAADGIYWASESGFVGAGNLDGSGTASTLFGSEGGPCGVAIDPAADKIFWANFSSGTIRVASLDGTGAASTLTNASSEGNPCGVAVDPAANKIYWANYSSGTIRVGNLDGSGTASTLFGSEGGPSGVAIDPAANKMYWTNQTSGTVRVGNLDGSGTASTLFGSESNPIGLAIDPAANKIYWANLSSGAIRVGNLDGSGTASTQFGGEASPAGVAIDPPANKIYWGNFGSGAIRVANLDGTGTASDLFTGQGLANFPVLLRAPTGTGPPTISGEPKVGEELSCSQGNWAPDLLGAFLFRAPRSSFEYQWLMDGGEIGGETAPTFTPTEPGTYACRVTASNQAGSSPQTSADVTVPAPQPPQTQVDSGPSGRTNDPTPTFTFSSPDTGASFECKLDSGSYSACSSPKTTQHLTDGPHTFYIRAKDSSANVDPTPASRSFTVRTASVGLSGRTLVVTAASGAKDNLAITRPSSSIVRVTDLSSGPYTGSGVHTGAGCTQSGDSTANCTGEIARVRVTAGDQNDQVVNSTVVRSLLNGGNGDDTLTGGSRNDTLTGGPDADTMKGMNGSDLLKARDLTSDTLINCDGGIGTPGSADRADLDKLPLDPNSVVKGCESKTRH